MKIIKIEQNTTTIQDTVLVKWGINPYDDNMEFSWDNEVLSLYKTPLYKYTKKQTIRLKKIKSDMEHYNFNNRTFWKSSIYYGSDNEIFHVTIFKKDGLLIWISRVDKHFPCYFFKF